MFLCVYHNNISTFSSIIYSLGSKTCYIRILPTGMFPVSVVLSSGFCVISNLHVFTENSRRWAVYIEHNIKACLQNHCHCGAISVTYSECVSVALVIQHAKHMDSVKLSSVVCLPPPYFSTLCQIFRKKLLNMQCV